jgi:diacylglycerol kinase
MNFSFRKQFRSFGYAFNGIRYMVRTQHNSWIHLAVTGIVLLAGYFFRVSAAEWCILLICIGFVLSAEAVNTALERLCDTLHPEKSEGIRYTKDVAAAAVLIASSVAVLVGLIIFVPRFLSILS